MSEADVTGINRALSGGVKGEGPLMSVTLWPRLTASEAIWYPKKPVEGFEIKRTGSINSLVGPAVISMRNLNFPLTLILSPSGRGEWRGV